MPASAALAPGRWTCWYDERPRPGALNMAVDAVLLERARLLQERWLRLYRWSPHCLSLGRHEPATRRYDRAAIAREGIPVVRRPTGGRAVWHARELTYAVALPAGTVDGGIRAACLLIHDMLRGALRALGIAAELAPPAPAMPVHAGACFARPVGGEILVAGRKVVGSAQVREGGALLQHGSILLRDDQSLLGRLTLGNAPADGGAPLEALVGRAVEERALARAIADSAEAAWGGTWTRTAIAPEPLAAAEPRRAQFESAEWTWRA